MSLLIIAALPYPGSLAPPMVAYALTRVSSMSAETGISSMSADTAVSSMSAETTVGFGGQAC